MSTGASPIARLARLNTPATGKLFLMQASQVQRSLKYSTPASFELISHLAGKPTRFNKFTKCGSFRSRSNLGSALAEDRNDDLNQTTLLKLHNTEANRGKKLGNSNWSHANLQIPADTFPIGPFAPP